MSEPLLRTAGEPSKPPTTKIRINKVPSCEVLLHREGFHIFSMGLLYEFANVDFDVMARFASERSSKATIFAEHINFPFRFFDGWKTVWDRRLTVVNKEVWDEFVQFMMSVNLVDRPNKQYWRVAPAIATIMDPLHRVLNGSSAMPIRHSLDVFLLSGNTRASVIRPKTIQVQSVKDHVSGALLPTAITLEWVSPEISVVKEAEAVFRTT